jgi:hypothetical protein
MTSEGTEDLDDSASSCASDRDMDNGGGSRGVDQINVTDEGAEGAEGTLERNTLESAYLEAVVTTWGTRYPRPVGLFSLYIRT